MSTTNTTVTAEQAAEQYEDQSSPTLKWRFLDTVLALCNGQSHRAQIDVIRDIAETSTFIGLHGDHRDDAGSKARSKITSISSELTVARTWEPSTRVPGISFEAHKVLNRLGSTEGRKILLALARENGGPGNVTRKMASDRLKVLDPDHKPRNNGKQAALTPPVAGNHPVTAVPAELTLTELATTLGAKLTVGDLYKDGLLVDAVKRIVGTFEAYEAREAAKKSGGAAKAQAPAKAPAKKAAPAKARKQAASSSPAKPKRPAVKRPVVKTPTTK